MCSELHPTPPESFDTLHLCLRNFSHFKNRIFSQYLAHNFYSRVRRASGLLFAGLSEFGSPRVLFNRLVLNSIMFAKIYTTEREGICRFFGRLGFVSCGAKLEHGTMRWDILPAPGKNIVINIVVPNLELERSGDIRCLSDNRIFDLRQRRERREIVELEFGASKVENNSTKLER